MYVLGWTLTAKWIGDGVGPQSVSQAQILKMAAVSYGGDVQVPGGDAPTQANFNTAITGTLTTEMENAIAANLGQIQGFSTGGG
jgi:hypothetical protein